MFVPIGHLTTYDHILLQIQGHDIDIMVFFEGQHFSVSASFVTQFWRLYVWRLQQYGKKAWIKRQRWKFRRSLAGDRM